MPSIPVQIRKNFIRVYSFLQSDSIFGSHVQPTNLAHRHIFSSQGFTFFNSVRPDINLSCERVHFLNRAFFIILYFNSILFRYILKRFVFQLERPARKYKSSVLDDEYDDKTNGYQNDDYPKRLPLLLEFRSLFIVVESREKKREQVSGHRIHE